MSAYYLPIAVLLLPWLAYFLGSLCWVWQAKTKAHFLQLFGSALVLFGMLLIWALYDPNFGFDPYGIRDTSFLIEGIEVWTFALGVALFFGALLLRLRFFRALPLWRKIGKNLSAALILLGACAGIFVARNVSLPWVDLPWSIARAVFTLCLYPHALGYLAGGVAMCIVSIKDMPRYKNESKTKAK